MYKTHKHVQCRAEMLLLGRRRASFPTQTITLQAFERGRPTISPAPKVPKTAHTAFRSAFSRLHARCVILCHQPCAHSTSLYPLTLKVAAIFFQDAWQNVVERSTQRRQQGDQQPKTRPGELVRSRGGLQPALERARDDRLPPHPEVVVLHPAVARAGGKDQD